MKKVFIYYLLLFTIISCHSKNEELELDKIIFHTDEYGCWGQCPEYHLEISQNLKTRLWIEKETYLDTIYPLNDMRNRGHLVDSGKLGYYTGKIPVKSFQQIKDLIEKTRFDTIRNSTDKTNCHDGLTKQIILYFQGNKRKEILYSCGENWKLDSLSNLIYSFIDDHHLIKTEKSFYIEDFK
jgi:hypothetical protein